MNEFLKSKIKGCILGMAVGDAFGMPFQSLSPEEISQEYGEITEFHPGLYRGLGPGQFTCDTMMQICFLLSLIDKGRFDLDDILKKISIWYEEGKTRGLPKEMEDVFERLMGGETPKKCGLEGLEGQNVQSLLRGILVGIYDHADPENIPKDSQHLTLLTHKNLEAIRSTTAVAFITSSLFNNADIDWILPHALEYMTEGHIFHYLQLTQHLLESDQGETDSNQVLGTEDDIGPALGRSLFAFLKTPNDFKISIQTAVSGGGQTTTIGALTGAFSGLYNGVEAIPEDLLSLLEQRSGLTDLAEEFCNLLEMGG